MLPAESVIDLEPLLFEDAVTVFLLHAKAKHKVDPMVPLPEYSKLIGSTWHLRDEHGLLARVNADRKVS